MNDTPEHLGHILFRKRDEQRRARAVDSSNSSTQNVTAIDPARFSRYASKALEAELEHVAAAAEGERNNQLNTSAFALAQLVAANALDETQTLDALRQAASRAGLTVSETEKTLRSAFRAGKQTPRELPASAAHEHAASNGNALRSTPDAPFGEVDDEQPPVEPPTEAELDDFWHARELLTHIQTYARARRASPWAVLGVVLARIVAATPPAVVLPPIVGGQASLNLFVGLVGTSGSGKGAAERVAAECIQLGQHIETVTTGSGEGIAHAYVKRQRDGEVQQHTQAVLFSVPEIDTLSALSSRQGATLMPELRRGWSGEQLGFAYADPTKRLPVHAHAYRMCLVAGIQPARARTLLDDADGGTPQRFIWCSATDRSAPDVVPDAPKPLMWRAPNFGRTDLRDAFSHGRMLMPVCDTARDVIDQARLARIRGDGDALDGHLLLSQLKTAAALAIADSRLDVTDDDWQLAHVIIKQSTATRASVAQALADAFKIRNRMRAESEADRTLIVSDKQAEAQMHRATRAVLRRLRKDESVASSDLKRATQYRDRDAYEDVIEALLATGQIEELEVSNGRRFKLVEGVFKGVQETPPGP